MRDDRFRCRIRPELIFSVIPLLLPTAIAGCGAGGTGSHLTRPVQLDAPQPGKRRLFRFDVDVKSGKVRISPADSNGRAILEGGALSFTSSDLLNVGGDSGKRLLTLSAIPKMGETLTQERLVIGNLSSSLNNIVKNSVTVSTTAGSGAIGHADGVGSAATFQNPVGIALGTGPNRGSYFVSDSANSTIRQIFPDGTVTTFAGLALSPGSIDGNGSSARFNSPGQIAVDDGGNVIVADTGNHTIRRITPLGEVTTILGKAGTAGHIDGSGKFATFNSPTGVAVQDSGVIFVSEAHDIRIVAYVGGPRTAPSSYFVNVIAGGAFPGSVDGPGAQARFNKPTHLAFCNFQQFNAPNLFVTDSGNNAIRAVVNPGAGPGVVTVAGGNGAGSADGSGTDAQFDNPSGIVVHMASFFGPEFACYVSDANTGLIRVIDFIGQINAPNERDHYRVRTLTSGMGFVDGDGNVAKFNNPLGISAVQGPGPSATLEIVDQANQRIRKLNLSDAGLSSGGPPSTVAEPVRLLNWDTELPNQSLQTTVWSKDMTIGGSLTDHVDLQFYVPAGVLGFSFTAYIEAETNLVNLPAVGASYVTTLAGSGVPGDSDGPGRLAQFNSPYGIAALPYRAPESPGPRYRAIVSDNLNSRIRILDIAGTVSTIAGSIAGYFDGSGRSARFSGPRGITWAPDNSIYVADSGNRRIRRLIANGSTWSVSTIAGTGAHAVTDGIGSSAAFEDPTGISADAAGNLYVTEYASSVVRKIAYQGGSPALPTSYMVTTIAGTANTIGSTDGVGAAALFNRPVGIYAGSDGKVYVADTFNHTIRAFTQTGTNLYTVTTIAGSVGSTGNADGTGATARFNAPAGISGDTAHNLYVCELSNHRIRRISPLATVVTLAGSSAGFTDGSSGQLNRPIGLSVSQTGNIYVTDSNNNAVRTVQRVIMDGQPP